MAGSLAASYGTFAVMAGRFLYPPGGGAAEWMYLAEASSLAPGDSFVSVSYTHLTLPTILRV